MTRKRITVVAPAYNDVEGIAHFVEFLLVDDGSTDETRERLDAPNAFSASKTLWPVLFDAGILSRGIPPRKASCKPCPG